MAVTKCDKLGASKRASAVLGVAKALGMPREAVVPTSASKGFGTPELWSALDAALGG